MALGLEMAEGEEMNNLFGAVEENYDMSYINNPICKRRIMLPPSFKKDIFDALFLKQLKINGRTKVPMCWPQHYVEGVDYVYEYYEKKSGKIVDLL